MADFDKLFYDGQEIEGTINSKLIEGVLHTQKSGTRVVLKEDGKWHKLSSLRNVRRIGVKLYEEAMLQATEAAQGLYKNIDFERVEKDNKKDEVVGAIRDTLMADRSNPLKDEDATKIADDQYAASRAEKAADETTGGDNQKAQEVLETYGTEQEDLALKESLRETLSDALKDELGGETFEMLWDSEPVVEFEADEETEKHVEDLFGDSTMTDEDKDWANEFSIGYEDPNYKNPTPEMEEDAIKDVLGMIIAQNSPDETSELVQHVLDNWEASPEEAEAIVVAAYERFLDKQVESGNVFKTADDEVDNAYEEEIDSYEGDDILTHLKDTFEVPEAECVEIIRESRGSVPRAIILMSEYTRRTLLQEKSR